MKSSPEHLVSILLFFILICGTVNCSHLKCFSTTCSHSDNIPSKRITERQYWIELGPNSEMTLDIDVDVHGLDLSIIYETDHPDVLIPLAIYSDDIPQMTTTGINWAHPLRLGNCHSIRVRAGNPVTDRIITVKVVVYATPVYNGFTLSNTPVPVMILLVVALLTVVTVVVFLIRNPTTLGNQIEKLTKNQDKRRTGAIELATDAYKNPKYTLLPITTQQTSSLQNI